MFRRLEQRIVNAINVPFLFRGLLYLLLTIYALVNFPFDIDLPVFPDPLWFSVHFISITLLALMSHANYPNHLSREDAQFRIFLAIIPPLLFLVALRQRWSDLFILIRRDKYGSILLGMATFTMGLTLIFYLFILWLLLIDMGIFYLIYQIAFTWIMYLPVFIIDILMWRRNQQELTVDLSDWQKVSVTGEEIEAARPFFYQILKTKRARFWILMLITVLYSQVLKRITNTQPIIV